MSGNAGCARRANSAEIDDVRQNLAVKAKGPSIVIGGESGWDDHGIRRRERPGVGIAKVMKREDHGDALRRRARTLICSASMFPP